jgi:hypothetical protein
MKKERRNIVACVSKHLDDNDSFILEIIIVGWYELDLSIQKYKYTQ